MIRVLFIMYFVIFPFLLNGQTKIELIELDGIWELDSIHVNEINYTFSKKNNIYKNNKFDFKYRILDIVYYDEKDCECIESEGERPFEIEIWDECRLSIDHDVLKFSVSKFDINSQKTYDTKYEKKVIFYKALKSLILLDELENIILYYSYKSAP